MGLKIRGQQDFLSGLLFIAIGAGFIVLGRDLQMGVADRMGPGYIPFAAALILVGLGTVVMVRGVAWQGEGVSRPVWRPLLLIPLAALVFGLTLERLGLVVAIVLAIGIARLAQPRARVVHTLAIAAGMAAFCSALFIYGFNLPIPVLPAFE